MDHNLLRKEALSVGCHVGLIAWPDVETVSGDPGLVGLVIAAHARVAGDPEITALRDYLGASSPEWMAYVECRKARIKEARAERFLECDRILGDLLESAITSDTGDGFLLSVPKEKWKKWLDYKTKVRKDLPYEVE